MKKLLLTTALMLAATPAFAANFTIKEVTDAEDGQHAYHFAPDKLTIQPGDTVTFENAQDDTHNVMFMGVPKAVDEMIMSPMLEDKGQKWSYTFTVPGTYLYHCHPHEALGMKGTIIVGTPSKPGETKIMDHHKMHEAMESSEHHHDDGDDDHHDSKVITTAPQGVGKVLSVDVDNHAIKLAHEPIKVLGWPKMKMLFNVDKDIDLSTYAEGDAVSFTLKPVGKDDYIIVNLKKD